MGIEHCRPDAADDSKQFLPRRQVKLGPEFHRIDGNAFPGPPPCQFRVAGNKETGPAAEAPHLAQLGQGPDLLSSPGAGPVTVDDERRLIMVHGIPRIPGQRPAAHSSILFAVTHMDGWKQATAGLRFALRQFWKEFGWRCRQDEVKIIALRRWFIAHGAPMHLNDMADKGEAVSRAGHTVGVSAPPALAKEPVALFRGIVRSSGEDIELDPDPAGLGVILHEPAAIGHGLARPSLVIDDLPGVLGGIGKQIGIDLGEQANVDQDLEFVTQHVLRMLDGDAGGPQTAGVVLKLGQNHLFFHVTAPGMQDKVAALEMFPPKQALQEQAHVGMVLDQFPVVAQQVLFQGLATVQAVAAIPILAAFGGHLPDLLVQFFQLENLFSELVEEMPEVHVGHNDIVLDIHDQGVDELEMVDILERDPAIVEIVADPVGILAVKEPVCLGQGIERHDLEHAQDPVTATAALETAPETAGFVPAAFRLLLAALHRRLLAVDGDDVGILYLVGRVIHVDVLGRGFRLGQHAAFRVADKLQAVTVLAEIQPAGHTGDLQGHGDTDAVEVLQRIVLLGEIKEGLQEVIVLAAEVIAVVTL